jgi:hypothetical protein
MEARRAHRAADGARAFHRSLPPRQPSDPSRGRSLGQRYCFEKGAAKSYGNPGFADVWKQGYFAFEYKKKKKNLGEALKQLSQYAWKTLPIRGLLISAKRQLKRPFHTKHRLNTLVTKCYRYAPGTERNAHGKNGGYLSVIGLPFDIS